MSTLEVADAALNKAIDKANELRISLVVAGDIHDTKANLRGECVRAMIRTFLRVAQPPIILVGNHDKINEKSEEHSLEFLKPYATVIDYVAKNLISHWTLIPYQHDVEALKTILSSLPENSNIIMHQGCTDSNSGHYIQDKTALPKEYFKDFRVVSGHYHNRQDIKCGRPRKGSVGLFSYIGNPYTLNFAEANDPEKGFQVLYDDGTLEFIPTNLREHRVLEYTVEQLDGEAIFLGEDRDIVSVKISGSSDQLAKLTKSYVAQALDINQDFKLDLIPIETKSTLSQQNVENRSQSEVLDTIINSWQGLTPQRMEQIRKIWRELA